MNKTQAIGTLLLVAAFASLPPGESSPKPSLPPGASKPFNRPLLPWRESSEARVGGPVAEDGTEIQCDLPHALHMRNTGGIGPRGPGTGAGLCVFTSIEHASHWQNVLSLQGFQKWMTTKPGGGYPEKVDSMIQTLCKERGVPPPAYLQIQSNDLDILKAACASGRMPGVTYSYSPTGRYGGSRIAHMVSLVHADDRHFVILDNNYPGADKYEWLTPEEFLRTYSGGRSGWAVILLDPGPPPPPIN